MANPPGVIGEFANVPAPGSAIRSDWPIEVSTAITDIRTKLTGRSETAHRTTMIGLTAATWTTVASVVTPNMPAGRYLCFGILIGHATIVCNGQCRISTHIGNSIEWEWEMNPINTHGARGKHTSTIMWPFTFAAGSITVNLSANANMAGFSAWEESTVGYAYLGT